MGYRRNLLLAVVAIFMAMSSFVSAQEITWWVPDWNKEKAARIIEGFERENPGITVKMETTVYDGLQNRILIVLRSNNTPDLIEVATGWNRQFASAGLLYPLDAGLAQQGVNISDFLAAPLDTATLNGKLYGMPYRGESHAIIYNKDAYRAAGLDPDSPPGSWEEFIEVSKKLTKRNSNGEMQYGFGIAGRDSGNIVFRSLPYLWMNGGGILSPDGKEVIVNSKASIEGVDYYTGMLTTEKVAPNSTLENDGSALRRLFSSNVIAQFQSGQYDIAPIRQANPNIDIGVMQIPTPPGKETSALVGGWNFVIPSKSKNKEATLKLLAYLADDDRMATYTNTFPTTYSTIEESQFQTDELKPFAKMLEHARIQPPAENWIQISQIYANYLQEILLGDMSSQEAMDAAAEEIQDLL